MNFQLTGKSRGWLAPLVLLALSACGGATITAGVGAPVTPVLTAAFVAKAQAATCSESRNKLYLVDRQYVYSDRAGNCPDNSYARELFGATPDTLLCGQYDSIAGPRTSCKDESVAALFALMTKNGDKADLGLGSAHQVEPIAFAPAGQALPFETIAQGSSSAVASAKNIVVRDAAAWQALWAAHQGVNAAPLPAVDFSKKMVVAVFLGTEPDGCYSATIDAVTAAAGKLVIRYTENDYSAACNRVANAPPMTPMHLVVLDRDDGFADFQKSRTPPLSTPAAQTIAGSEKLLFTAPENIVVRDSAAWTALWAAHQPADAPATAAPAIDFAHAIVVGVAMGRQPGPCFAVDLVKLVSGKVLTVDYTTEDNTAVCNPTPDAAGKSSYPVKFLLVSDTASPSVVFNHVPAGSADFSTLDNSIQSGITSEQTVVVKDAQAWAALWAAHGANVVAPPNLPVVDFSQKMVIAAFMGTRPSGCYAIRITSLLRRTGRYAVSYAKSGPAAGAACSQAVTTPAHIIVTDRSDAPVDFVLQ